MWRFEGITAVFVKSSIFGKIDISLECSSRFFSCMAYSFLYHVKYKTVLQFFDIFNIFEIINFFVQNTVFGGSFSLLDYFWMWRWTSIHNQKDRFLVKYFLVQNLLVWMQYLRSFLQNIELKFAFLDKNEIAEMGV